MLDYSKLAAIRLGYGLSPVIESPADPQALVATVAEAGPKSGDITMDVARQVQLQVKAIRDENADDRLEQQRALSRETLTRGARQVKRRLARAVRDPGGFGERLVQFWADHFTVRAGNGIETLTSSAMVTEAIRPHITGKFGDMMFAAETHPAMVLYLDQQRSVGPNSRAAQRAPNRNLGLNENLAREMIELHSLGVTADYSQEDVRELASLLTGLYYDPASPRIFLPGRAEPGAETVLGVDYGGEEPARLEDIRAVIAHLAAHEATAAHIARKMAVHFIADDPPQPLVDRLTRVFADTEGDLAAMNLTLAEAPELETHLRQKVRQPLDFMVASLRAIGLDGPDVMALTEQEVRGWLMRGLTAMGQPWSQPRGPDGWPEEAQAWATPQGIAARTDWIIRQLPRLRKDMPDPRDLMHAAFGDAASEALQWAVPKAENAREGIAVVLASAEFNRR
ncbi:DUF1800 domain-containing protein [Paracoccus caeni]|nr:DUF1800 domain-containing protein [Paracoccus caeni]